MNKKTCEKLARKYREMSAKLACRKIYYECYFNELLNAKNIAENNLLSFRFPGSSRPFSRVEKKRENTGRNFTALAMAAAKS
jgi:hypothetical protein